MKIHFKTDQGIKTLSAEEAEQMGGQNPDHHVQDLFEAIERKEYPTWTAYLQIMDPIDAQSYRWNIFDMTKVWPQKDYPLMPFGKLVMNKNVSQKWSTRPSFVVSGPILTNVLAVKLLCGHRTGSLLPIHYGSRNCAVR